MTDIQLSPHFNSSEFDCKGGSYCGCGGRGNEIHPLLIKLLEQLRYNCGGYVLTINSGYRCPTWNAAIDGSATNSQHCKFVAADVSIPSGLSAEEFLWYVETTSVWENGVEYKFDGIGFYPAWKGNFIHVDIRDGGVNGGWYRW